MEADAYQGRPLEGRRATPRWKRPFDFAVALPLGIVVSPLILGIACISWFQGRPAFFGHRRVGQDGLPFVCWKLRTMHVESDLRLERHLRTCPEAAQEWADTFKLKTDPRVTCLGRILRATSLDELPQLWNVLRGDMSVVGPRPITFEELSKFEDCLSAYTVCRPGLTGLWQIASRQGVPFSERLRLDCEYAQAMSLALDLRILGATMRAIAKCTGY